ncbi:MAG: 16S rRNA (cytosine(967)-C(5))-methyltransferase RsmB [Burkholderiales bacterium]
MLEVQRLAGAVIGKVLGGRSLDAELAALGRRHPGLSAQQRAAIQDICFGALRFLGRIDAMLQAALDKPLKDARLRSLLQVALYQLEYTRAAPHAVVDHAVRVCEQLHLTAAKGLVNAVLRNFLRRRAFFAAAAQSTEAGRYSHPQWWIDKLRLQYPERYAAILEADNLHPPMTLRVNCRHSTTTAYLALLEEHGIEARVTGRFAVQLGKPLPVERIPGFAEGMVSVQDASAQCAAPLLDACAGMRVLDACAAPGGKTAHLLELADVELTALDRDAARLERLQANLGRLKLTARIASGDACEPCHWWDGKPFDRILADAPCSASGVVRRHPDIKWLRRAGDIEQFARQQCRILDALWRLLGSGGKLLYATCSVFREENQLQVIRFLERHPDAQQLELPAVESHLMGSDGQILPDERHDGFFYALLQKN